MAADTQAIGRSETAEKRSEDGYDFKSDDQEFH